METELVTDRRDTVVIEVRDRYNNRVSGVGVRANNSSALRVESPLGNRSDADGRVSYTVTPTEPGNASLAFASGDDSDAWENVSYDRRVDDPNGGGGNGGSSTASFVVTPDAPKVGETATFDASGSTDDGTVASYEWAFGDGTTATDRSVSHAYDTAGTDEATSTVTDDDGNTDTHTESVTVTSHSPSSLGYPSDYRDQNGGASIPPDDPAGAVSSFSHMQATDGQSAQLDTRWDSPESHHEMRIGVETTGVPNASTYEFGCGTTRGTTRKVRLVDSSGAVLQSQALSAPADTTTVNFTLNQAATDSVRTDGTLYAVYRYSNANQTTLYAYYQRVETYD